jgi:hypothetical protein
MAAKTAALARASMAKSITPSTLSPITINGWRIGNLRRKTSRLSGRRATFYAQPRVLRQDLGKSGEHEGT